ncbi:hypothetical protein CLOP_g16177 [Closterium sp. NIES-67]|nr:hypothetical protein CLOP_g16177 [Closterium sp. NIES-67]
MTSSPGDAAVESHCAVASPARFQSESVSQNRQKRQVRFSELLDEFASLSLISLDIADSVPERNYNGYEEKARVVEPSSPHLEKSEKRLKIAAGDPIAAASPPAKDTRRPANGVARNQLPKARSLTLQSRRAFADAALSLSVSRYPRCCSEGSTAHRIAESGSCVFQGMYRVTVKAKDDCPCEDPGSASTAASSETAGRVEVGNGIHAWNAGGAGGRLAAKRQHEELSRAAGLWDVKRAVEKNEEWLVGKREAVLGTIFGTPKAEVRV